MKDDKTTQPPGTVDPATQWAALIMISKKARLLGEPFELFAREAQVRARRLADEHLLDSGAKSTAARAAPLLPEKFTAATHTKLLAGDALSDVELEAGICFFLSLANDLKDVGPHFGLFRDYAIHWKSQLCDFRAYRRSTCNWSIPNTGE